MADRDVDPGGARGVPVGAPGKDPPDVAYPQVP
jgi:hypothetical protein